MSAAAMLNAKNVSKRKASPIRNSGPATKRAAPNVPAAVEEEDEEPEEVEFVVGASLEEYPELSGQVRDQIFPYSEAQEALSEAEKRALRQEAAVIVRAACDKMCARARGAKVMHGHYQRYLAAANEEDLAHSMCTSITDPVKLLIGSKNWSLEKLLELGTTRIDQVISGTYFGSCGPNVYIGSSGDMSIRLGQHIDQVLANRTQNDMAQVKLWYQKCCEVDTHITAKERPPPRFTYLAVNQRSEEPEFQEALESVLISIFDVFRRGRLTSYAKQVKLTRDIRPAGLPNLSVERWTPCNASLPICMAYHGPPTPFSVAPPASGLTMAGPNPVSVAGPVVAASATPVTAPGEKKKQVRKPVEKRQIISEPSLAQLQALFLNRVFKKSTDYADARELFSKMRQEAETTQPMIYCHLCDCYMIERTFNESHKKRKKHIAALADEEREAAEKAAIVECKVCEGKYRKLDKHYHKRSQKHQWALPEHKRDPDRWVFCEVCCLVQWYKMPGQGAHEGSASHTEALRVYNLAQPKEVAKLMVYCPACNDSYHRDSMRAHLDTPAHSRCLKEYEANTPADNDVANRPKPKPSKSTPGLARLQVLGPSSSNVSVRPQAIAATADMDETLKKRKQRPGSKDQGLGKENRRHTKGGL
ncbi:hypothetical protein LTR95_001129 [Oleoguttula sp. CCFEE 5521]